MDTVFSKKNAVFLRTSPVPIRAGTQTASVDLFSVRIPEPKQKQEKRLGYLGKKELIEEVRKIFPNAKVLPNEDNNTQAS
jgi:hypothetical protein